MSTNADPTAKPGSQPWGIYHADREYARIMGDPIRTVLEVPTKVAAEEAAARLGFGNAWAHPLTPEQARSAQWTPIRRRARHARFKRTRGIRV